MGMDGWTVGRKRRHWGIRMPSMYSRQTRHSAGGVRSHRRDREFDCGAESSLAERGWRDVGTGGECECDGCTSGMLPGAGGVVGVVHVV